MMRKLALAALKGLAMRKLLFAIALAIVGSSNAVAQQFSVYDAGGRYLSTNVKNGNVTVGNGMYSLRHGNRGTLYDSSGRVLMNSVKRGNAVHHYNSRGRLVGKSYYRADGGFNMYNAKGRYVGQGVKNQ
jgi:2',3'-cyclic-nucleotide 2'-phosphodiesterase (5'-nucleotidase family)